MLIVSSRLKWPGSWLVAILAACLFYLSVASSEASGQDSGAPGRAGRVVGHIDGIRFEREQFYIRGWACQQGNKDSLDVHIYADRSAYDNPKGTLVLSGTANLENEASVDQACQGHGGKHRFEIALPAAVLVKYQGRKLYAHGIRKQDGAPNAALARSGEEIFPSPPIFRSVPDSYPRLSGTYTSLAEHPRVFTTQAELNDLVRRINSPGTFSAQSFVRLANRIRADLAAKTDWDATYSGCDIDIYLRGFSFESRGGYPNEIRTEAQLSAAMSVKPGASAPAGGAVVASRLALYAALVGAGAKAPEGAPTVAPAIALAKRILLAWADHGFRDQNGSFRQSSSQFCDAAGKPVPPIAIALQISRGVVYSVHGQDLLEGLTALSPDEEARLNHFHLAMYEVIRSLSNEEFSHSLTAKYPDEVYNNQFASNDLGLLATARLLDDKAKFIAALNGGEGTTTVKLPWVTLFDQVIYGPSDKPLLGITPNSSSDPLKSRPAFTTPIVAAGEINDRYRNSNPLTGIGYPIGTLKGLFEAAEVLRIAGFDPYGYRGAHKQSIEMATQYYACYGKYAGFYKTVTPENAQACSDYQQYVGKIVNEVEAVVLIGAYRFPKNEAITDTEAAARIAWSSAANSLDAIRFGKWRD